jgi:hypothetical protein
MSIPTLSGDEDKDEVISFPMGMGCRLALSDDRGGGSPLALAALLVGLPLMFDNQQVERFELSSKDGQPKWQRQCHVPAR